MLINGAGEDNENTIYHNNFIMNSQNAWDECTNIWYHETLLEGNFWDDFVENPGYPDAYQIPGGSNIDPYPLIIPWGVTPGDLDLDGDVEKDDLVQLLANYGTATGATYWMGDLDGDGDVDLADLSELLRHYGYGT